MKICPVGGEFFHADGQTGTGRLEEASCRFSQFCERTRIGSKTRMCKIR